LGLDRSDDKQGAPSWLHENAPDCGDNSCLFGGRGKGGMRTNGGCRCFKDLPTAKRIYVERLYAAFAQSASGETGLPEHPPQRVRDMLVGIDIEDDQDVDGFWRALRRELTVSATRETPEVRLNEDGTLDEIAHPAAHLEQMDYNHWFLEVGPNGDSVAVWLRAKGKIEATFEYRRSDRGNDR
jgi:hypothetical protein